MGKKKEEFLKFLPQEEVVVILRNLSSRCLQETF